MLPATCSSSQPLLHDSIFSNLAESMYSVLSTLKRLAAHHLRNIAVYISFVETNAFNRDFLAFFTQELLELCFENKYSHDGDGRLLFSRNFNLKDFFLWRTIF